MWYSHTTSSTSVLCPFLSYLYALMLNVQSILFVCMCSIGLANPGEAFTVFSGERNPWCEYEIDTVKDFHHLMRFQDF